MMSYKRSFEQLHTHVLCERAPTRELEHDRALVYDALRQGRCYIANDKIADARGFAFWADDVPMGGETAYRRGVTLHARIPQAAKLRLLRDGEIVATTHSNELHHPIEGHGVHRLEVMLEDRPWIYSNPVYIRR
jgi:hypothetical protein